MATNTFLAKVKKESGKDEFQWISQNRTLYADQLTENGPTNEEERKAFCPKSMKDVFDICNPRKTDVNLETEDDRPVAEDFEFHELKDFEDEQLIEKSPCLRKQKQLIATYNAMLYQLERNRMLKNVLKDDDARATLEKTLLTLIAELEEK